MRIGIIGAGKIGSTLASELSHSGHHVMIANSRGPETLDDLEYELRHMAPPGAHPRAASASDAAHDADVVILAIPYGHIPDLPSNMAQGKTLVDATNYYPERDGHVAELDAHEATSSELVRDHFPDARVVKAFNTMRWDHVRDFARSGGSPMRYGMPVAADDEDAKRIVADLVSDMGFAPVDAGGLADGGRKQEPGSPIYTADLEADDLATQIGGARLD